MIGFDAIGQSAIGELASAGTDLIIFAPSVDIAVASNVPVIIGTQIFAPASPVVVVTDAVPFIAAGKSEAPPAAAVTVTTFAPGVSISATLHPATAAVAATSDPAEIQAGNVILASNTVTHSTANGEIGSSSIGEFAIGEGEPETHTHSVTNIIIISVDPPLVTAGKAEFPPAANVNITSVRAEIDSRGRKLRVFAIAS